jgi:site-specific DNA-methyltransferase (adenine-specific)
VSRIQREVAQNLLPLSTIVRLTLLLDVNNLYYGDNLDVLRRYVKDESVDLIYLDPPFKSNQDYNVLFAEKSGTKAAAQIKAFEDTWEWDEVAAAAFEEIVEKGGRVAQVMLAFRTFLEQTDMLAYLSMMAPRLVELRRVMKPTASIYLHCDPTASHYLKMLMDAVFGPQQFRNEIIWKRTSAHSSAKRYGPVHDVILFFGRSDAPVWNAQYQPHDPDYLASHYRNRSKDGRAYTLSDLTAAGVRHGSSGKPWKGFDPTDKGNHWKFTVETLDKLNTSGRIYWPDKKGGWPRYVRYLDEVKGTSLQDVWTDIDPVNAKAAERLGYPTQKPVALMERIISASSNEGETVLDPFCGCGTTVAAAQRLSRRWIGIDITHLAISLIKIRLSDAYGKKIEGAYKVVGEPVDLGGATQLANEDKYQFQWWALGLVGARPVEQKKGADHGIDGRLFFHDEKGGKSKQIIFSVKGGGVSVKDLRDLRGVVDREKAEIGILVTLEESTKPMRVEANGAGFYHSVAWKKKYPKLQIVTVADLLKGEGIDRPPAANVTFKQAPKAKGKDSEQLSLAAEGTADYDAEAR